MPRSKEQDPELEAMMGTGAEDATAEPDAFAGEFEVDMSAAADVEPGVYHARVADINKGVSQSGNPKLMIRFWLPELGRDMTADLPLVQTAMWKTAGVIKVLGFEPEPGQTIAKFTREQIVGVVCEAQVANHEWQGNNIPQIEKVLPATAATHQFFETL